MFRLNCTWRRLYVLLLALVVHGLAADSGIAEDSDDEKTRRAAIAAVLQAGGHIRVAVLEPTVDRLERLSIVEINLRDAEVDNDLLTHVGNLKEVQRLDLTDARIDDLGLLAIAHLPLRELWLQGTNITDVSAVTISGIQTLDFLQLNSTTLSDEFLHSLDSLPELEDLGLRGTQVTGAGMQHLSRHPKLKKLDVYLTAVDDAGVESLSRCKTLTFLGLSKTKISSQVFEHLAKLPRLTDADLTGNRSISTAEVLAFEAANPRCDIEWYRK